MVCRPICLPSPNKGLSNWARSDLLGMTGFATGWGVTDLGSPKAQAEVLQQVRINRQSCRCPIEQIFLD